MKRNKLSLRLIALILAALLLNGCGAPPTASAPAGIGAPPVPTAAPTEEIATLDSLEMVDDYPLYTMRYHGAYSQRASSADGVANPAWACSLFAALGDADNLLYGRNFDWEYSPALLLFTDPPDGYASVSMVDIAYLGFGGDKATALLNLPLAERRSLLDAPFLPFDGMNERGLVVGMAAVPQGQMQPDPDKETIDSLMVIREMLDHAANVDEAVAILQSYNVDFGSGPPIHYLIADRSGRSALVEFYQGEMVVISNEADYHLATNFLRASAGESAEGECWRYDLLNQQLAETEGRMTTQDAVDLLAEASQESTQWSVVYEMNTGNVNVAMGREYDDVHTLRLSFTDTPIVQPPSPDIVADLQGLDVDEFPDASYHRLLLRDPELITELGLVDTFGVGNDQLTDISDAYVRETQQLEAAILDLLNQYDRDTLTPEQQLSADIYTCHLQDRVRGHEFMYNDYPLNPIITSAHNQLVHFFTQIHPVTDHQDAKDYVARLSQVDAKWEQLQEGLRLREEAGVLLPRFIIQWVQYNLQSIAHSGARSTPFYTAFEEKVNALDGLSDADRQALLEAAEAEINASVIPAYQMLADYLEHQESIATDDDGVWKFPNGDEYYAHALRHHTTTDLTAGEIHQIGLDEVTRLQAEMRALFDELGYPSDENLPALFGRVARDGGSLYGNAIVAGYEAIIEEAERNLDAAFDLRPRADVIVIGGPTGGYYQPPAIDGSRPGAFYASDTGTRPKFSMPSLAYHEALPGHHLQIAIAQELDLPSCRNAVRCTAYIKGWALYAEQLAWEMGLYEGDPYGKTMAFR